MTNTFSPQTVLLLVLGMSAAPAGFAADPDIPFKVTEDRERCSNYAPERQALFGTTHLHTGLSFDASINAVDYSLNNPRTAYKFARGNFKIQLPDPSGMQRPGEPVGIGPSRSPEVDYPLDWGAVTDHAEHFGVMGLCKGAVGEDIPEVHSMECRMLNRFFYQPRRAGSTPLRRMPSVPLRCCGSSSGSKLCFERRYGAPFGALPGDISLRRSDCAIDCRHPVARRPVALRRYSSAAIFPTVAQLRMVTPSPRAPSMAFISELSRMPSGHHR